MDRFAARKRIVADLDALGLLEKIDDHKLSVPRGDRSGAIIEPYLTDQWYVDIKPLAEPAIAAVENGDIEFVPKSYENTYFAWMRDIQDWCISRQQWWGHRIPAYYDDAGNVYVGRSEDEVRTAHGLGADVALRQEDDVLETWFSSALWTFGTLGWPEDTEELSKYHPTDVLVTGHDIIFFWVARMIMMTLKFMGQVPFRKVYIHGLVRDGEGRKMSKTKGNGLDPLDFMDGISVEDLITKRTSNLTQPQMAPRIEKATRKEFPEGIAAYGTDAVRFMFCASASTGRDVRFDVARVEGYRNFCNKLWNASRFVLDQCDTYDARLPRTPSAADRWIESELSELTERCHLALSTYRFDLYANSLYEFIWHNFCDWYLELTKPVFWNEAQDPAAKAAAQHTLLTTLEGVLRLTHPVMPFITEALWQEVAPRIDRGAATIMLQEFPQATDFNKDTNAQRQIRWLQQFVTGVRNIRGEANLKPGQKLPVLLQGGDAADREFATDLGALVEHLARIETPQWLDTDADAGACALNVVGELKIMVPLAGLIDIDAEVARLQKQQAKLQQELQRVQGKLRNAKFVDNAPDDVVAKEREKAADYEATLDKITAQIVQLQGA